LVAVGGRRQGGANRPVHPRARAQVELIGERRPQPAGDRLADRIVVGVVQLERHDDAVAADERDDPQALLRFGDADGQQEDRHGGGGRSYEHAHDQYRKTNAIVARQNERCSSGPTVRPLSWLTLLPRSWKRRSSHATPTELVRNPTAPTPTSNAGTISDRLKTSNVVVLRIRIMPAPATTYGRKAYSVSRCGAATTMLPVIVVTRL